MKVVLYLKINLLKIKKNVLAIVQKIIFINMNLEMNVLKTVRKIQKVQN